MNTEHAIEVNVDTEIGQRSVTVVPQKSKGQLFKEKYGYSLTMHRNMRRIGCLTVTEYRRNYSKHRAGKAVAKRNKHMKAVAGRKTKSAVGKPSGK